MSPMGGNKETIRQVVAHGRKKGDNFQVVAHGRTKRDNLQVVAHKKRDNSSSCPLTYAQGTGHSPMEGENYKSSLRDKKSNCPPTVPHSRTKKWSCSPTHAQGRVHLPRRGKKSTWRVVPSLDRGELTAGWSISLNSHYSG